MNVCVHMGPASADLLRTPPGHHFQISLNIVFTACQLKQQLFLENVVGSEKNRLFSSCSFIVVERRKTLRVVASWRIFSFL